MPLATMSLTLKLENLLISFKALALALSYLIRLVIIILDILSPLEVLLNYDSKEFFRLNRLDLLSGCVYLDVHTEKFPPVPGSHD